MSELLTIVMQNPLASAWILCAAAMFVVVLVIVLKSCGSGWGAFLAGYAAAVACPAFVIGFFVDLVQWLRGKECPVLTYLRSL